MNNGHSKLPASTKKRFWLPFPHRHASVIAAAICFLALMTAAMARISPSLLVLPLELHLGWSRAAISMAMAIALLMFGLTGPFAAAAMVAWGIRKTMIVGLCAICVAAAASSMMTQVWHFAILWGLVIGVGTGAVGPVLISAFVPRWFAQGQGTVIGILSASTAVSALLVLPYMGELVSAGAWLPLVALIAMTSGGAAFLVSLFLPERPCDVGADRFGESNSEHRGEEAQTLSLTFIALRDALSVPAFWLLAISFLICGLTTNGLIGAHFVAYCGDRGMSAGTAAGFLAIMGVFDLAGTTISGFLSDRINPWRLLVVFYVVRGLALVAFPLAPFTQEYLTLFIILFGLDYVATVPPTVRLANEHFGLVRGPIIFGWIMVVHQIGAAIAAFGGGVIRTLSGDYVLAFLIAGALAAIAGIVLAGPAYPALWKAVKPGKQCGPIDS